MAKAGSSLVSLLMIAVVVGLGYGVWKYFPVYFTAWQVDHVLQEGGARAYQISRQSEPGRSRAKETLVAELRQKVVELGIKDPEMVVTLDFVGEGGPEQQRAVAACAYNAWIEHINGKWTKMPMSRRAETSMARPKWE